MSRVSMDQMIAELGTLQPRKLNLVLLQYCLELTISARMHFVDNRHPAARDCNETLHSILGFLRADINEPSQSQLGSMVDTIVRDAEHAGRLQTLALAIRQACAPTGS